MTNNFVNTKEQTYFDTAKRFSEKSNDRPLIYDFRSTSSHVARCTQMARKTIYCGKISMYGIFFLDVLRGTIKWSATGLILVKTPIGPENFIPNPLDISLIVVHMEFTQNVRASGKRTDALRGEYRGIGIHTIILAV